MTPSATPTWRRPVLGALLGIAATTAVILSGQSALAALAIFPLVVVFWDVGRHSRREMGFVQGRPIHYGIGLLHPAIVLSIIALAAWIGGAFRIDGTDWSAATIGFLTTTLVTVLMGLITEEGVLGIKETAIYGPEVGGPALTINVLLAIGLWRWHRSSSRKKRAHVQPELLLSSR